MEGSAPRSPEQAKPTVVRGPTGPGLQRRRQILDAAAAVFAELGYSGGSIRTIADRVGTSPATLLQHFGSKAGLLSAVLEDWGARSRPAQVSQETGINYFTRLPDVMRYNMDNRGIIELYLTMSAEATNPYHPAHTFIRQRYDTIVAEVTTHFHEAINAGHFRPLTDEQIHNETRTLFAVMDGLQLQWLLDPTVNLADAFRTYLDHALTRWGA